jgi:hypothetical protein
VTDPGVRVWGPEVGSLTSRLLSATLCAAAEAAAASFSGRRDSLSTNCHSVIGALGLGPIDLRRDQVLHYEGGDEAALAPSPLPHPPHRCVTAINCGRSFDLRSRADMPLV